MFSNHALGQVMQGLLDAFILQTLSSQPAAGPDALLVAFGFAAALRAVAASFGVELLVDGQALDPVHVQQIGEGG